MLNDYDGIVEDLIEVVYTLQTLKLRPFASSWSKLITLALAVINKGFSFAPPIKELQNENKYRIITSFERDLLVNGVSSLG